GRGRAGWGGGGGPVTPGCPCPVDKHAHDGTGNGGRYGDQGDLPAGHVAGDAVEGVGRGPESDDHGGRAWRRIRPGGREGGGRGRGGRRQGGGQPGQRAGETADGADGIHDKSPVALVCGRPGGVAVAIAGGSPAADGSGLSRLP